MYATSAPQSAHQVVRTMSAQAGAAAREARAAKDAVEVMQRAMRFGATCPDVVDWVIANSGAEFADSLADYLNRNGSLTDGQVAAVRAKLRPSPEAPMVSVGRIETAFAAARASGLSKLRMHLDSFVFKPAGARSANAGGIYVTEEGTYLGKVMGGQFLKTRECSDEQQTRIVAAASDPEAAARAYGQRTGRCSICGRELTAEESIERFVGPICAQRYGF